EENKENLTKTEENKEEENKVEESKEEEIKKEEEGIPILKIEDNVFVTSSLDNTPFFLRDVEDIEDIYYKITKKNLQEVTAEAADTLI
ncbi:MAG: hypothetical protein MJ252_27560, partial [archaeon]|nr:hypothetical protein [archaeon]